MWLEVAVGLQGWWSGGKADCEVEEGKEAEELSYFSPAQWTSMMQVTSRKI